MGGYSSERVTVYEWLRMIATLAVVIGHGAYLVITTTYGGVNYALPADLAPAYDSPVLVFLRKMAGWVYGFHMPLFFCLSGAVLHLKPVGTFDSFCRKKIGRLLVPYFLAGLFFMLPVKYLGGFYTKSGLLSAIQGFWSGIDSGHLWFLPALFWCMVVFVAMVKILERLGCRSEYALLFLSGAIQINCAKLPFDVLGLKQGLAYIFWFACGYLLDVARREGAGEKKIERTLILAGSAVTYALAMRYAILDSFFKIVFGCLGCYGMARALDAALPRAGETAAFKVVSRNLFYIYLFHDPLEYIVLRFFMEGGYLASNVGCYAYVFCRIPGVIIICILLGETVQKGKRILCRIGAAR